jgi:hypothetical protein
MNPNNVDITNTGFYKATFKDGQILDFNWPNVKIKGILTKDPHYIMVDKVLVKDNKNGYVGEGDFIRTKAKGLMSSMFSKKKDPEVTNQVKLKVSKKGPSNEDIVLAEGL